MYSNDQILQKPYWSNGPAPGQFYNFTGGYNGINSSQNKEYTTPGLFGTQHSSSVYIH